MVGRFFILVVVVVALVIIGFSHYNDDGIVSTTTETMKVVRVDVSRGGQEVELVDRSGKDTIVVTGDMADAIAEAKDSGGAPLREVRAMYETVRVASPAGKGVMFENRLRYWRQAYDAETW